MKRICTAMQGFVLVCLSLGALSASAQDAPTKEPSKISSPLPDGPQLKVQITFSEYEGEKKIKNLPYTVLVLVGSNFDGSKLRMGDRVPIATGSGGNGAGALQFQYVDVGTNIDCKASSLAEGRYRLSVNLERSWVQSDLPSSTPNSSGGVEVHFHQPTIRQFRTETSTILRDGQTVETNFATDPLSGKVIKVEIGMNVMK